MGTKQILQKVKILPFKLGIWVGFGLILFNSAAFAWNDHGERYRAGPTPYRSPPSHGHHRAPDHDYGWEHSHSHHPHHRCRYQWVPYWDFTWGVWSQRLERSCW